MKASGITQKKLAEHLTAAGHATDAKTIAHWCRLGTALEERTGRRKPHPDEYAIMADLLKVNPGWLMFHGKVLQAPVHPDIHQPVSPEMTPDDYEAWRRWNRLSADEKRAWMIIAAKLHRN